MARIPGFYSIDKSKRLIESEEKLRKVVTEEKEVVELQAIGHDVALRVYRRNRYFVGVAAAKGIDFYTVSRINTFSELASFFDARGGWTAAKNTTEPKEPCDLCTAKISPSAFHQFDTKRLCSSCFKKESERLAEFISKNSRLGDATYIDGVEVIFLRSPVPGEKLKIQPENQAVLVGKLRYVGAPIDRLLIEAGEVWNLREDRGRWVPVYVLHAKQSEPIRYKIDAIQTHESSTPVELAIDAIEDTLRRAACDGERGGIRLRTGSGIEFSFMKHRGRVHLWDVDDVFQGLRTYYHAQDREYCVVPLRKAAEVMHAHGGVFPVSDLDRRAPSPKPKFTITCQGDDDV